MTHDLKTWPKFNLMSKTLHLTIKQKGHYDLIVNVLCKNEIFIREDKDEARSIPIERSSLPKLIKILQGEVEKV